MMNQILLATDFSTRSDRALRRATMLAREHGAGLSLVHVVDDDQPSHLIRTQIAAARVMLQDSARTLSNFDGVPADAVVQAGDLFSGILDAAEQVGADLIVMGAHRRQLRDIFVGTTAERTIAHSRIPVLMAAGVPSAPYARALIALDLDERSKAIADRVDGLGIVRESEIVAMHAFDAPGRGMMQRAMADADAVDHYVAGEELRASTDFSRLLTSTGLRRARQRLSPVKGSAARTILECAADEDAALIIVGTSQRKGIERFVLGSVAEDVLKDADRDVLVIPK